MLLQLGEVRGHAAEIALRIDAVFLLFREMQQNFPLGQSDLDIAGDAVNVHVPEGMVGDDPGVEFDKDVSVSDENGRLLWFASKDEAVDLAVLPLLPDQKKFDFKAIPISMFVDDATLKSKSVSEGDSLYFIGLLAQFYGVHHNYPVIRRGTLAMMTDELIEMPSGKQKGFVAELQSWPGNSGSPVFLNLSGFRGTGALNLGGQDSLRLLGVLEGVFENKVPVSVVGQPELHGATGTDAPVGVSIVIPAMQIREILDSPEAQRQRDLEFQELLKSKAHR